MKAKTNHLVVRRVVEDFRFRTLILLAFFSTAFQSGLWSQCLQNSNVFWEGEKIEYDLYYKWGILMPKGGTATMTIRSSEYKGEPAWKSELLLNSSGMLDKMFRVRDTIENYVAKDKQCLLFASKRTSEGGYYEVDNLTYTYKGEETHVHSLRRNLERIKTDTILVGGNCVLDILGSLLYARSFDWTQMTQGHQYQLQVAMGRSVIPVAYRYEGQRIIERGNVKYGTRYFVIDIYDDAFAESKEALELWLGDDDNHIPIKVKAKLKIGALEGYYKSSSNLHYPLTSRIEMPKK